METESRPPNRIILQHSSGPIRWMPTGSAHRAIVDQRVYVVDAGAIRELDGSGSNRFLDTSVEHTEFQDPIVAGLSQQFSALRPLTDGGIWEGLVTAITGQAVSLHSAAAFQRRLCAMLGEKTVALDREFWSLPGATSVAESSSEQIKSIGLTTKRSEGLIRVAREFADGNVSFSASDNVEEWMRELQSLPMVGAWTAASALLWGVGHPDVYPAGDVALLRAARLAYDNDGMTMKDLNKLSDNWRPQRAIAARLLWTNLLGMGWDGN